MCGLHFGQANSQPTRWVAGSYANGTNIDWTAAAAAAHKGTRNNTAVRAHLYTFAYYVDILL